MADGTPFVRSYTWTKSVLQQRGLVTKAAKRSAAQVRFPCAGVSLMALPCGLGFLESQFPVVLNASLADQADVSAIACRANGGRQA